MQESVWKFAMGMKNNILLISVEPPEISIAEMHDGRLVDLHIERGGRVLNDIFKGRVENVVPGMDAAFVNIGLARNALIYAGDIDPTITKTTVGKPTTSTISQLIKSGQEVLVQVARPPVGVKGARVTKGLSLAGRFVVLSSGAEGVGVSRRIESEDERARLRRIGDKLRPLDHGLVIRTEADGISENLLTQDVNFLVSLMHSIRERAQKAIAPSLVHREAGILGRIVRDRFNNDVQKVWIDSRPEYESFLELARASAPQLADRVTLYTDAIPMFRKFGVAEELVRARQRTISLPHGGSLVIDETEALTAIDVNTGKFTGKTRLADTVLQTNLEAVEESSRQMRLRDLGGVIVIDFIDMERHRDRIKVLDALETALKPDQTKTRIVQLSPSGLVEITRRREGHSLRHLLHRDCPYCDGDGMIKSSVTVAIEMRRRVREALLSIPKDNEFKAVRVTLHPDPACAFLGADDEYIRELESATNGQIFLQTEPNFHLEASQIEVLSTPPPPSARPAWPPKTVLRLPGQIALFPHEDKEPQFVAWNGILIALENARESRARDKTQPLEIEITANGRWHHSARIL